MADKSVGELIAAQSVTPTDLFVLEQNGTAKKLTGQILENWLVSFADGHGGIQSIVKKGTSGLVDTYRITLADTTTFDFMVTNGKGINSVSKVSTSGLVDTYRITLNDGTSSTFTVTNGAKGDPGDNAYIWIKYASQEPTKTSHSFGDIPDAWIGVYFGGLPEAPTDWMQYKWYQWKGDEGEAGGYYIPKVSQQNGTTIQISFSASKKGMDDVEDETVALPPGPKGEPGNPGVYVLSKGETIDDVPEWAEVVVDPYKGPSTVTMIATLEDGTSVTYKIYGEVVAA